MGQDGKDGWAEVEWCQHKTGLLERPVCDVTGRGGRTGHQKVRLKERGHQLKLREPVQRILQGLKRRKSVIPPCRGKKRSSWFTVSE